MKIRKKIGNLGKDKLQQIVEAFISDLEQGAVAVLEYLEEVEDPEFLELELDEENKIISFTAKDGSHYVYNLKSETIDALVERIEALEQTTGNENFENIEDIEGRLQIGKDHDNKIFNYRKPDGTLVENTGIETPNIKLSKEGLISLYNQLNIPLNEYEKNYKAPNLPKYGVTNIKTEEFYVTAHPGVNSINDVVLLYDVEDTDANAADRMTIAHYYVKSTLIANPDGSYSINENSVRLQHYAYTKVKEEDGHFYALDPIRKVGGICYFADSLGFTNPQYWIGSPRIKVIGGYTRIAPYDASLQEGKVKEYYVEVVGLTGPVCVNAWTVEDWAYTEITLGAGCGKKYEHRCTASIDFGHYLTKSTIYVGVKHQGNSTMGRRKRNFRYTFYKKSDYNKKDKIKIGEMLRLSKFNLKANQGDSTDIKELVLYRIFLDIWNSRPITDRYDWDNAVNGFYIGATGNIKGFPVKLEVNDEFYGIYIFALPKDGKNYCIDDEDENTGLFISGSGNTANDWGVTLPYPITSHYDSEMDEDDLNEYPGIIAAMETWTHFINNRLYKGSDENTYNVLQLTDVDNKKYVTSSLVPGAGSVTAEVTNDNAYRGSDGELYILSELTDIDGTLYVTDTLSGGQPTEDSVTAVSLDRRIYLGSDGNRYISSELSTYNDVKYVTTLIVWDTDSAIEATLIEFNRDNIPERLDVIGFIDYIICLQVFLMIDSVHNNVIFYSGPEKKKMFPFFYDLDSGISISRGYDADIFAEGVSLSSDLSLWNNFIDIYWDDIVNRYCELRRKILSISYIRGIYQEIGNNIPDEDYVSESAKWNATKSAKNFEELIRFLSKRLDYLDTNYFKI